MRKKFFYKERMVLKKRAAAIMKVTIIFATIALLIAPQPIFAETQPSPLDDSSISLLSSPKVAVEQTSLANVKVLGSESLTGNLDSNTKKLILNYSGKGLLTLGLLEHPYIIFQMPTEFSSLLQNPTFINGIVAKYDVPIISLLGINLGRDSGTFSTINVDATTNTISVDYHNLLSLKLLSSSTYNFTLEINLESLPASTDGVYTFLASTRNAVIDLSVLAERPSPFTIQVPIVKPAPEVATNQNISNANSDVKAVPEVDLNTITNTEEVVESEVEPFEDSALNQEVEVEVDSGSDKEVAVVADSKNDKDVAISDDANLVPSRNKLPETATDLMGIALIGFLTILLGLATRFFNDQRRY